MTAEPHILAGKRVLIVEDELLVALLIEDILIEFGCNTFGPCGTLEKALAAASSETLDLAVLDINLAGERAYPVAEALERRNIPFLFVSGYGDEAIPEGHETWKVCAKPFKTKDLTRMLEAALRP